MEGVTLEHSDRVDAGSHVPTVQVTTDIKRTSRHLLIIEVIRHVGTHFPSSSQTDVSVQYERVGELHVVIHLLVVKGASRGIGQAVIDGQAPRYLCAYVAVIHILVFLLMVIHLRVTVISLGVFFDRLQRDIGLCATT